MMTMTEEMYKEQLERQYLDLNNVDKFVVDNYEKFLRGLCLDNIVMEGNIKNYTQTGIIKKLNYICTSKRMRKNTYRKLVNNDYENIPDKERITVYTIKPKEQIPDIYNIIEYIKYNNINTEELNKNNEIDKNKEEEINNQNDEENKLSDESEEDDIITKNKRAEEEIIINNEMLFRYGVKTKWLKQLGIKYSPEFLDYWFHKKTFTCNSKYGKTLPEKYKNLGINENIYKDDFKKKTITLYRLSYLP